MLHSNSRGTTLLAPPTLLREELPLPPSVAEEALSRSVSEVKRTLFISLSELLLSQCEDRRRAAPPGGKPNGLNLEKLQGGWGWHQEQTVGGARHSFSTHPCSAFLLNSSILNFHRRPWLLLTLMVRRSHDHHMT